MGERHNMNERHGVGEVHVEAEGEGLLISIELRADILDPRFCICECYHNILIMFLSNPKNILSTNCLLFRSTENVLFVSVHGYGPREQGMEHLMPHCAFYPGSGRTVLPTIYPPKDGSEVRLFYSIQSVELNATSYDCFML